MRRKIGLMCLVALAACSSEGEPAGGPADPTSLSEPIATGIAIAEVAMFQSLKFPLANAGAAAPSGRVPLVAGRDALLRVYVKPEAGWSAKPVTARLKLVTESPTGTFTKLLSATKTVSGASTEADLESTLNVPIPGAFLQQEARYVVVLNEAGGTPPSAAPSPARFPQDGALAPLGARGAGESLRVTLVPVEYRADGSGRLPDTTDEQVRRYREILYKLYPVARVEVTVHAPFVWSEPVAASGKGLSELLAAIGQLRRSENPPNNVYYYGAVNPADTFDAFCRGGCTTGLSPTGAAHSVGVGFGGEGGRGDKSAETAAHEIGHAHNLRHAPCGGAGGPDPEYPSDADHAGAKIGVWGYNLITKKLVDPGGAEPPKDLMAYCRPSWISDFHYAKLLERVRSDHELLAGRSPGAAEADEYDGYLVEATGVITPKGVSSRSWELARGEAHALAWLGPTGARLGPDGTPRAGAVVRYFPYDHLPGGELWVPRAPAGAVAAEVVGLGREPSRLVVRPQ
ncbi:MAG: hypothetical protein IPF92_16640 [Myxococcales bacterium]|nr:hypothetical protein [Myxococcales bacterium]